MKNQLLELLKTPSLRYTYLPYAALTLLIMGPLLSSGYILTLDMVFVPHPPLPETLSSSYLFHCLLHFLSFIVPSDIIQKIILCLIVFLAALGSHLLIKHIEPSNQHHLWRYAPYLAGLFYAINPFVYARFMAGQYSVLLGYALLPWFVRSLLQFLAKPSLRSGFVVAAWTLLISIVSIHTVGILLVITLAATAAFAWQNHRNKKYLKAVVKYSLAGIVTVLLLSSYWLVPALLGHGPIADASRATYTLHSSAFATQEGLLGILQLHGFWAESADLFRPTTQPLPFSGLWQLLFWIVIIAGIIAAWRYQRAVAFTFTISLITACAIALGLFQEFLVANIPFFAGYREPHKFVMIIALCMAYFGAWGVRFIIEKIQNYRIFQTGSITIILLLPLLITPTMLWGFNGQLRPYDYPKDWYSVNNQLSTINTKDTVLFLPWHLYMRYSFAGGRIVANPAEKFFANNHVIVSDNPELGTVTPLSPHPLKQKVSKLLAGNSIHTLTAKDLRDIGISHVLLAQEGDVHRYERLVTAPGFAPVTRTDSITLYKVEE